MVAKYPNNLFWSEEDREWVADVPDLQSCSAFGDTPAEALAEVEKAMDAWLAVAREDGLPIPEPRYHASRRASAGALPESESDHTSAKPMLQELPRGSWAFGEVREKAHELLVETYLYFCEKHKHINEIIFVPSAIFLRIIGTHDSIGALSEGGHVLDAAIIALAQFELRVQLLWTSHDIKNAAKWVEHSDLFNTPEAVSRTINKLYPKPSDERRRLHSIFSHLSGVKHANPVMSELAFAGRPAGAGFVLSTGTIEDGFCDRFSQLLREFSIYQLAWCSHVISLYVAKYAVVDRGLREHLRQIGKDFAPAERELAAFMEEVTRRQRGFFGLRANREARRES